MMVEVRFQVHTIQVNSVCCIWHQPSHRCQKALRRVCTVPGSILYMQYMSYLTTEPYRSQQKMASASINLLAPLREQVTAWPQILHQSSRNFQDSLIWQWSNVILELLILNPARYVRCACLLSRLIKGLQLVEYCNG